MCQVHVDVTKMSLKIRSDFYKGKETFASYEILHKLYLKY